MHLVVHIILVMVVGVSLSQTCRSSLALVLYISYSVELMVCSVEGSHTTQNHTTSFSTELILALETEITAATALVTFVMNSVSFSARAS